MNCCLLVLYHTRAYSEIAINVMTMFRHKPDALLTIVRSCEICTDCLNPQAIKSML